MLSFSYGIYNTPYEKSKIKSAGAIWRAPAGNFILLPCFGKGRLRQIIEVL